MINLDISNPADSGKKKILAGGRKIAQCLLELFHKILY